ncbi:HlyD family type I secretion periplasmic adaptor subunit [Candidatus Contendibacter odensensis]|uniref:Membrane fusion protein (MFP) family protein n=1 Tax=Candidatus Contendobacter odensis Run_B_J11 TaxID=1400861 RepID=A0A7U7J4H5_9GAMM|nr:HlyD family type I secretion periplasmic adaptor subunit [Candidatus Contendobacter odensis]CDH46280.1 Type I secretion membrane fusion protein, HlyD family [Candidatus Contendobacter odensis Run_B_J11]
MTQATAAPNPYLAGKVPIPLAPTDDRPIRRLGFLILLAAFGGFGGWAATAQIDSAAVAAGTVTVESYRKTVQHLEGGIVSEILVKDGDTVKEGDILLQMDGTQARAQLEIARVQYFSAQALESRLLAERKQTEIIAIPDELKAEDSDPRVREAISAEQQTFIARRTTLKGEISLLRQQIEQLQEQTRGLDALAKSKQQRITSYTNEANDFGQLAKQGFSDKLRQRELERAAAELEGERAQHLSDVSRAKLQIGQAELQILQLQKRFQSEVAEQLREVQAKLFDLRERMRALQDTVARTTVRAPASGKVVGMGVHTVGGVLSPGTPILDIVPQGEQLIVEAHVQVTDIDKMHPGLLADVRFSSFKSRTTPVLEGRVMTVSADRLVDRATNMPYYLARIQVPETEMSKLQQGQILVPGMPAEVFIKTGERTALQYLLQPLLDAAARSFREK